MSSLLLVGTDTPRSMVFNPPLTDCQFEQLRFANDIVGFERTRVGEILIHPPSGSFTSEGNAGIVGQLRSWWKSHRRGRTLCNGGFFLDDGSMLSPGAAYVLPAKLQGLTKDDLTGFPRLCPDFVIELLSVSDSLAKTQEKMVRWIENGASLGWLIDPHQQQMHIYEPGRKPVVVSGMAAQGSGPVEGFVLDLAELWRCYEV